MLGSAADKLVLPNDAGFSSGYVTKKMLQLVIYLQTMILDLAADNLVLDNDVGLSADNLVPDNDAGLSVDNPVQDNDAGFSTS